MYLLPLNECNCLGFHPRGLVAACKMQRLKVGVSQNITLRSFDETCAGLSILTPDRRVLESLGPAPSPGDRSVSRFVLSCDQPIEFHQDAAPAAH